MQPWAHMASIKEGDCIFHYLPKGSLYRGYQQVIVAISRVKTGPQFLNRQQFQQKLQSYSSCLSALPSQFSQVLQNKNIQSYYNLWDMLYSSLFNKYQHFIFVETEVIKWLVNGVSYDDLKKIIPELGQLQGGIIQGYLTPIRREWGLKILSLAFPGVALTPVWEKEFDLAVLASLVAGKNLLVVGPPGSGKTSYLRELLEKLGIGYVLRVGNPEWTAFDVVGGLDLSGEWRDGFLTAVVKKCVKEERPVWVLIDELNRANLDLALGDYFTFLDVEHREKPLLVGSGELRVPYSFRILGTMNNFDRALLHKLGFALRRRFAVVDFRFRDLNYLQSEVERFCKRIESSQRCEAGFDVERALRVFKLGEPPDYAAVFKEVYDWFSKNNHLALTMEVDCSGFGGGGAVLISLSNLLACVINEVDDALKGYQCEVCPVKITPGVVADALRFLVAVRALNTVSSSGGQKVWPPERWLYFVDFAFATYIMPQLDVMAGYVQVEGREGEAAQRLKNVAEVLRRWGLKASAELAERLSQGFNVP